MRSKHALYVVHTLHFSFPPLKGIKHLVCEPYHIESKEYDRICTDERFDLQDHKDLV